MKKLTNEQFTEFWKKHGATMTSILSNSNIVSNNSSQITTLLYQMRGAQPKFMKDLAQSCGGENLGLGPATRFIAVSERNLKLNGVLTKAELMDKYVRPAVRALDKVKSAISQKNGEAMKLDKGFDTLWNKFKDKITLLQNIWNKISSIVSSYSYNG